MAPLSVELVEMYLSRYGWQFRRSSESFWRTGFQGSTRYYPLDVELTKTCLTFAIKPLIDLKIDWRAFPEIMRDLLHFNGRMQLAKAAVGVDGEVTLVCHQLNDVFTDELGYSVFAKTLGVLGHYADELAEELLEHMAVITNVRSSLLLS